MPIIATYSNNKTTQEQLHAYPYFYVMGDWYPEERKKGSTGIADAIDIIMLHHQKTLAETGKISFWEITDEEFKKLKKIVGKLMQNQNPIELKFQDMPLEEIQPKLVASIAITTTYKSTSGTGENEEHITITKEYQPTSGAGKKVLKGIDEYRSTPSLLAGLMPLRTLAKKYENSRTQKEDFFVEFEKLEKECSSKIPDKMKPNKFNLLLLFLKQYEYGDKTAFANAQKTVYKHMKNLSPQEKKVLWTNYPILLFQYIKDKTISMSEHSTSQTLLKLRDIMNAKDFFTSLPDEITEDITKIGELIQNTLKNRGITSKFFRGDNVHDWFSQIDTLLGMQDDIPALIEKVETELASITKKLGPGHYLRDSRLLEMGLDSEKAQLIGEKFGEDLKKQTALGDAIKLLKKMKRGEVICRSEVESMLTLSCLTAKRKIIDYPKISPLGRHMLEHEEQYERHMLEHEQSNGL